MITTTITEESFWTTQTERCFEHIAVLGTETRVVELAPWPTQISVWIAGIWVQLLWIGFAWSQLCSTDYFWSGLLQNWLLRWRKLVGATAISASVPQL